MKIRNTALALYILLAPTLHGCVNELSDNNGGGNDLPAPDETALLFSVTIPPSGHSRQAPTRTIGDAEENSVEQVDVLAYRYDEADRMYYYAYHAVGHNIAAGNSPGEKTFSLTAKTLAEHQKFVVITNAHTQVQKAVDATSAHSDVQMDAMLQRLQFHLSTGQWEATAPTNFQLFPMWGESFDSIRITEQAHAQTLSSSIPLLRMPARIDVVLSTTPPTTRATTSPANVFLLTGVRLYNYQEFAAIVPARTNLKLSGQGGNKTVAVTAPTIPVDRNTGAHYPVHTGPLLYGEDGAGNRIAAHFNGRNIEGAIYTLEAKAPPTADRLKATCLVVAGIFDANGDGLFDERKSYYRLDLDDILRNHRYVANIIDVKGHGYDDPETAFVSKSLNMVATILEWDDRSQDVVFDRGSYLAVTPPSFLFYKDEACNAPGTRNLITVSSNYLASDDPAGKPSGWNIASNTGASWLHIYDGNTPIATYPSTYYTTEKTLHFRFGSNPTQADRKAVITFAAGQLKYEVVFTQSGSSGASIRFFNDEGEEIIDGLITFAANSNVQPAAQSVRVEWTPADHPIAISVTGNHPVEGSGLPITETIDGGGIRRYNIQPRAITATDARAFDGYETQVTFFVDNNPPELPLTRTLTIRQVNYALRFTTEDDARNDNDVYLMDRQPHTFTLQTNFPYLVEKMDGNDPMLNTFVGGTEAGGSLGATQTNLVRFTFHDYRTQYNNGRVDPGRLPHEMNLRIWRTDSSGRKEALYGIYTLKGTPLKVKTATGAHDFTVPASGGDSEVFIVSGIADYQLKAKVVTTSGDGSSDRPLVNHAPRIIAIKNGTERPVAVDTQGFTDAMTFDHNFKVRWGRLYYPNREIPNIRTKVQFYLYRAGSGALFEVPDAAFTVRQEMLTARARTAWAPDHEWGSLTFAGYSNEMNPLEERFTTIYDKTTATPPLPVGAYSYIHLGMYGYDATDHPTADVVAQYRTADTPGIPDDDAVYFIGATISTVFTTSSLAVLNSRLPAGYRAVHTANNLANDLPPTTATGTRVCQFVTGSYSNDPNARRVTLSNDMFYALHNNHAELDVTTPLPATCVPLIYGNVDTGGNAQRNVLVAIDPSQMFVFWANGQLIEDVDNRPSYERGKFFYNIIDYITLSADYGVSFSYMLVDGLLPDGTPAPAAPWDAVWGVNAYPN
jgi:hypothetical protein